MSMVGHNSTEKSIVSFISMLVCWQGSHRPQTPPPVLPPGELLSAHVFFVCWKYAGTLCANIMSSNLFQRTGGDHRGGRAQIGRRTFMMTCLHWILGYMRLQICCKIGLSGYWCPCTALCTRSGALYYWLEESTIGVHVFCCEQHDYKGRTADRRRVRRTRTAARRRRQGDAEWRHAWRQRRIGDGRRSGADRRLAVTWPRRDQSAPRSPAPAGRSAVVSSSSVARHYSQLWAIVRTERKRRRRTSPGISRAAFAMQHGWNVTSPNADWLTKSFIVGGSNNQPTNHCFAGQLALTGTSS